MPTILDARDLHRRAVGTGHELLKGVTLKVDAGARLVISGASGSGKTVLLRALAWLDRLDGGELLWHDQPLTAERVPQYRSHALYVGQRPTLMAGSVEDNLRLPLQFSIHRARRFDLAWIKSQLATVGRDTTFLHKNAQDLSGGESQLVNLLRGLQLDAQLLLLDEPTAALDRPTAELVEKLVTTWQLAASHRRALVWTSHDPRQILRMATDLFLIKAGDLQRVEGEWQATMSN